MNKYTKRAIGLFILIAFMLFLMCFGQGQGFRTSSQVKIMRSEMNLHVGDRFIEVASPRNILIIVGVNPLMVQWNLSGIEAKPFLFDLPHDWILDKTLMRPDEITLRKQILRHYGQEPTIALLPQPE